MIEHSWQTQKAFLVVTFKGVLKDSFTTQDHVKALEKYEPNYTSFVEYTKNLIKGHFLNKEHVDRLFGFLKASHFSIEAIQVLAAVSKKADYEYYSRILFENKEDADVLVNAMSFLEKHGELHSKSVLMKEFFADLSLSKGFLSLLKRVSHVQNDLKFLEVLLQHRKVFNQPEILTLLETLPNECVLEEKDVQEILNVCTHEVKDLEQNTAAVEKILRKILEENERVDSLGVAYDFLGFFASASASMTTASMSLEKDQLLNFLVACPTMPDYSLKRNNNTIEVFVSSLQTSESFSRYVASRKMLLYVIDLDIQNGSVQWSLKKENNQELLTGDKIENYRHFSTFLENEAVVNLIKNHQLPAQKPIILSRNPSW